MKRLPSISQLGVLALCASLLGATTSLAASSSSIPLEDFSYGLDISNDRPAPEVVGPTFVKSIGPTADECGIILYGVTDIGKEPVSLWGGPR